MNKYIRFNKETGAFEYNYNHYKAGHDLEYKLSHNFDYDLCWEKAQIKFENGNLLYYDLEWDEWMNILEEPTLNDIDKYTKNLAKELTKSIYLQMKKYYEDGG